MIHPTAIIGANVEIGEGVTIGPYCVIGGPAEHPREPYVIKGKIKIGNGVTMTMGVTVDSPLTDEGLTIIGDGCYLMAKSHVGHDVKLGKKVTLSTGATIGGHSIIGDHSTIGLKSCTHQRTELAKGTMIGANSFIKGNHTDQFRIFVGSPAKDIGPNSFLIDLLNSSDLPTGEAV